MRQISQIAFQSLYRKYGVVKTSVERLCTQNKWPNIGGLHNFLEIFQKHLSFPKIYIEFRHINT